MKYLFIAFAGICLSLQVWAQKAVINDPNAQIRDVGEFHGINVSNAIDLYLSQGDLEAVAVSAKDVKSRDRIRTTVEDGVLYIKFDNEGWSWESGNKKLKAYVSVRVLDKLSASGACDVFVNGTLSGPKLELHLSGASDFKGSVRLNELSIEQSGASDVSINGSVDNLKIEANGASNIKGYDLVSDICSVHATGASDVRISVNKELNAHASGASSIYYKGNGVIRESHLSGASSVSKKS